MTESVPGLGAGGEPAAWKFAHALLFTGHMIDRQGRKEPRFPASAEEGARVAICEAVGAIRWAQPGATVGLAGAASGGDILFHEVCAELGIATQVLLALPVAEFLAESVEPAGTEWERRYYALLAARGAENVKILGAKDGLLEGDTGNVWQRTNLWMLEQSLELAPERTLLALWDGKTGDGPGGTEHFVQVAERFGIRVAPIIEMQKVAAG